jgi:hypothetical protein
VAKVSKSSHTLKMRFAFSLLTLFCFCADGCKRENSEVPKYSAEEVRSIEQEANQGNAESAYLRGTIEEQGLSGQANAARAAEWYKRADTLGNDKATIALGLLYWHGTGVPKDAAEAARWFQRAADHGRADAQYYLAGLYERGEGLAKDEVQALKWLLIASRGQPYIKEASVEAGDLKQRLSQERVREAERAASEFRLPATTSSNK